MWIAGGNTIESGLGAALIGRLAGGRAAFDRAPDFFRFALAALVAPLVSATIGGTALTLGGSAHWSEYGRIWLTWWLGDASSALLVAPLLLLWNDNWKADWSARRYVEALAILAGLAGTAYFVFLTEPFGTENLPLEFFTLPFLIWTAFRFGPKETALALVTLSAVATWGTLRGSGPFGGLGIDGPLILRVFMVTAAVTAMCTAALVVDRQRSETERLRSFRAEQVARQEAEATNTAKDRFMAMLGHELRNPLAAIMTGVHVMERVQDPESAPPQQRAGAIVRRQVAHLTRLVDDLLDVGRVNAGKLALSRGPVNLADVAAAAAATLDAALHESRVTVEIDCAPVWVYGDAVRLNQVVGNLLTNAVKFTPAGGAVQITARRLGDEATFVVADTGIGIESALLPRIFDLFSQGDTATDHLHHGLGIGLTLVKMLVELHGGTVQASSAGLHRGSTFTVRLPAISPAGRAQRDPGESTMSTIDRPGSTRRVLIAEDEADLRHILRAALELAGHEVFEAGSGPDAVDAVERVKPHVAVVDIGLPQFDGYEVARQVRQLPGGQAIFLVALTGYGHPNDRDRARAAGFDLHLLKPIDPVRLNELLVSRRPS